MSTLDREAVARHLCRLGEPNVDPDAGLIRPAWQRWLSEADALIAASVRPIEGVTLTPAEARLACLALLKMPWSEQKNVDAAYALADRLVASC